MTPDLERAVAAMLAEDEDEFGSSSYTHLLRAALRALLAPSPAMQDKMAQAHSERADQQWRWSSRIYKDLQAAEALRVWRAGLNAILAAEGK